MKALAFALTLLLAAGATQRASAQPPGTPYELNAILPLTGPTAFFGQSSAKTMSLIADRVNATGGLHGRPLHIVVADDQSSPQIAVQLANGLIAKHAPLMLGPGVTATCAATAPLVQAAGPVMFCISPYITTGGYVYVTAGSALDNAVVVLRYYRMLGYTRFAMLNATDASGQALDKAFDDAFALRENRTLDLVAHAHFGPSDQSVAAQMSEIKAAAPQVLISWTVGSPFSTVVRGMHDSGLQSTLCTNGANMTQAQMTQLAAFAPSELDFLTIPTAVRGSTVEPRIAAQQRSFEAMFARAGIVPDGGYANAYDMVMLAIDALRNLPADAGAAEVRAYLAHVHDWAGANAIYDFRFSNRGSGQNGFELARFDASTMTFAPVSRPGGAPLARARTGSRRDAVAVDAMRKAALTVALVAAFGAGAVFTHLIAPAAAAVMMIPQRIDLAALTVDDLPPGLPNATLRSKTLVAQEGATVAIQIGTVPKHYHADANEIQYVVDGTGTEWLGTTQVDLKPGILLIIPKGTPHGGTVETSARLKILAIKTPPQASDDTHLIP